MTPLRALLYARVSSPPQKRSSQASIDEPSLGQQAGEMEREAAKHGWQIVAKLEDVITGSVPVKERPAGAAIYEQAAGEAFDVLMIYDNDRLGRDEDGVVAKVFRADMRFLGKQIFSVHQPVEPKPPAEYQPYEDDSALWLESVSDTASSVYIRQFRRRHAFGMRNRIEQKKLLTGPPPIGYRAERHVLPNGRSFLGERQLDPSYAPVVQRIFDEYEAGRSFVQIARLLNLEGSLNPYGKLWTADTIDRIINSPVYYGAAVYYKHRSTGKPDAKHPRRRMTQRQPMERWLIVEGGQHPAIITKAQWERCQTLKRSRVNRGRTFGESHLLAGLVRCGKCGAGMHRNGGFGMGYFSCNRHRDTGKVACCPNSYNRARLEADVREYLATLARSPKILEKVRLTQTEADFSSAERERETIQTQLAALESRLEKAREAFEAGIDSMEEYARRKGALTEEHQTLTTRLQELQRRTMTTRQQREVQQSLLEFMGRFSESFQDRSLRLQKLLLREIIEKIVVNDRQATIFLRDDPFLPSDYNRLIEIIRAYSDDPSTSLEAT